MTTNVPRPGLWYLAVFGRCEIAHFESEAELEASMKAELRAAGVDLRSTRTQALLHDAYIDLVHEREEGPVEWGAVEPERPILQPKRGGRQADRRSEVA